MILLIGTTWGFILLVGVETFHGGIIGIHSTDRLPNLAREPSDPDGEYMPSELFNPWMYIFRCLAAIPAAPVSEEISDEEV